MPSITPTSIVRIRRFRRWAQPVPGRSAQSASPGRRGSFKRHCGCTGEGMHSTMRASGYRPAAFWGFTLLALACTALSQQRSDYDSLLASAQQAQVRGDFDGAARLYQQASVIHPERAELKANAGLMYYQANRSELAAASLQQAIRISPELFVPNLFLGLDYVRLRRFNEAIPYLKRAARIKPDDFHAAAGLGDAYEGVGNIRMAIRCFHRATEIDGKDADSWFHLGVEYLKQVEGDARTLVTQYHESAYVAALMGENFAQRHAWIQASRAYQQAFGQPAVPPDTHAAYGFVLMNENDLAGAERELHSELASNPGSLLARLGMAKLALEQRSSEMAAEHVAQIWKTDPGFLISNAELFSTGLEPEKKSDFHSALRQLVTSGELSEEVTSLFQPVDASLPAAQTGSEKTSDAGQSGTDTTKLYSRGSYRQCSEDLRSRLDSLAVKDLRMLAFCAYATGDYEHAFLAAEKLVSVKATEAEGLYWEIRSSQRLSTSALARASDIDSSSAKFHVLLGDIYREQRQSQEAEREYRRALGLQPRDSGALFGLCLSLLANGRTDEALQVAQGAVLHNPRDPELNAVMGEILCQREDFLGAETYLKKSLDTKPEYVAQVHALLGKVYSNTNRTQEAIRELKLALPADKNGHLFYQIARLYLKIGDRDAANRAFLEAKRLTREGLMNSPAELGSEDSGPETP
ncbi:tetratricopeptide repeat protein [Acidobacteria bacterium AB60]|nr:tetratricopeptide repeat protein [Acidobacteria bacterium AB60]